MKIILKDKDGAVLHTANKYCNENIEVGIEAEEITITPSTEEQVKEGLFNKIIVGAMLDTSDATATAEDIAKDKTAYVNGEKVVGTSTGNKSDLDVKIDLASFATGSRFINTIGNSTTAQKLLKKVDFTNTDLSTKTTMASMLYFCKELLEVKGLNASTITVMNNILEGCSKLKKVEIYNTHNVANMNMMFADCPNLNEISELDCSSTTSIIGTFNTCTNLELMGGLKNLGMAFTEKQENYVNYKPNLSGCTKLTHESLMNIVNGLYDLNLTYDVANGGTLYKQTLWIGSTNLAKLTANEIAIATNKGWNLS